MTELIVLDIAILNIPLEIPGNGVYLESKCSITSTKLKFHASSLTILALECTEL